MNNNFSKMVSKLLNYDIGAINNVDKKEISPATIDIEVNTEQLDAALEKVDKLIISLKKLSKFINKI